MLDLKIESLGIEISNAAGHEHRIGGIAERAAALFASEIDLRYGSGRNYQSMVTQNVANVTARPVNLDLSRSGDEQAAEYIARAWMDALALRLKV